MSVHGSVRYRKDEGKRNRKNIIENEVAILRLYTPSPVSDIPVSVQNPAIDGHSVRLSTELSDSETHVGDYDTITNFHNLRYDPFMSIRVKISDIEEKT